MPEFVAVSCSACKRHQVVHLANRFECRICGVKQSQSMILGRSSKAKELRLLVQEANMKQADPQLMGFTTFSIFDACLSEARSYPNVEFMNFFSL